MSSMNNSSCLIDLSGDESPTSSVTMMSFPPISADEMIVQPLGRLSVSNNPFDTIEKQAKLFGDPFEITELSTLPRKGLNTLVPLGELIQVDGDSKSKKQVKRHSFNGLTSLPENSTQFSPSSPFNNSENPLNSAMCTTTTSFATNSSCDGDYSSDTMNHAFLQSDSSIQANSSTTRNRIQSDPVTSKFSKTMRKIASGKSRSASLEQICLKNQLRKSLSNSPIGSPNWSKCNNPAVSLENSDFLEATSLAHKQLNSSDLNRTSDSIFDDLLSTKPEWIDSDNDDNDFERMTIPFLKNMREMESTVESITDCSDDRSVVIDKLSKFRKTTPETAQLEKSVDVTAIAPDKPSSDVSSQVNNISSIIETLRDAVSKCGDDKRKGEASALLDNLNSYLSNSASHTIPVVSHLEPQPIVRQRTFCVEGQLSSDDTSNSAKAISRELNKSLPVISDVSTRKSITGCNPITPRRYSRSMTYNGKPVSVVSAIQNVANARERRSSVCTTPTRLVRQSTSNPTSTRTSVSRKSLSLSSPSKDIKCVAKTVERKTIMKTSNPIPSNAAAKPLKLRVGEQTKPIGPLKAVIPFKRTSSITNKSDVAVKTKKSVQTSTPLGSNLLPKSTIPAASSTPDFTNAKPSILSSQHGLNRNRLSYAPSAPNVNLTQPASEIKKKRVVTFSEGTDKMSQSMIVGNSHLQGKDFQPVTPLQRRRLSRSYVTNKENSILQKK